MTGSVGSHHLHRLVDGPELTGHDAWDRLLPIRSERDADTAGLVRHGDGPWRWRQDAAPEAQLLAELYVPLCVAGATCAFAQLGQSLDGAIATRTGDAVFVTGEEDRLHLHRLRALADAVVVGVDTVRTDDPQLTVRACAGPNPVRVILDHRGRVDQARRVFTDSSAPTLWVLGCANGETAADMADVDGVDVVRLPCDSKGFTPRLLLDALAERGLGRVLIEGGGVTVSRFLAAGALHRLYLTIAPLILGDGVPGLRFPGTDRMGDALRAPARRFMLGVDTLFELDLGDGPVRPGVAAGR
jgi:diaminohydroxyphosphoribosylaminopyrimidine deaminase/5-amino-6-(5-phosphoribosylamino)uracil reductase